MSQFTSNQYNYNSSSDTTTYTFTDCPTIKCTYTDINNGLHRQYASLQNIYDIAIKTSPGSWEFQLPGGMIVYLSSGNGNRYAYLNSINMFEVNDIRDITKNFQFDTIKIDMFNNGQGNIYFIKSDITVNNTNDNIIETIQLHPDGIKDKGYNFISVSTQIWSYPGSIV